jgi:cytoskeleton protein RodZ
MITAGEVLKNKRELLKKSLEKVSVDTKIQRRFLEHIENNQFEYFDSEVFLTGFIKIYAKYLELDIDKVLALYRRSNPQRNPSKKEEKKKITKTAKKIKGENFVNPKTVITIILIAFLAIIIGYIGFQIYKFQSPPVLNIIEPANDTEVTSETIFVRGNTDVESLIEVNGSTVEVDGGGDFEAEISLQEGSNMITVKARKNNALEKVETITILYKTKQDEDPKDIDPEEIVETSSFALEIFDSPAWIRLDIDGENKISQVIEPSRVEFELQEKFYIITGRLSNTRIYYNDSLLEWQTNQTTGVAELTCELQEGELSCE